MSETACSYVRVRKFADPNTELVVGDDLNAQLEKILQDQFYVRPKFPFPITAFSTYYFQGLEGINIPLEINPKFVSFLGTGTIVTADGIKTLRGGVSTYIFNTQSYVRNGEKVKAIQNKNNNLFGINDFTAGTSNLVSVTLPPITPLIPKMYVPLNITDNTI